MQEMACNENIGLVVVHSDAWLLVVSFYHGARIVREIFQMARSKKACIVRRTPGKKSLAIDAFAHALRAIPTIIADNAGLDSADLVAQLRADHQENDNSYTGKLRSPSVNVNTKW